MRFYVFEIRNQVSVLADSEEEARLDLADLYPVDGDAELLDVVDADQ